MHLVNVYNVSRNTPLSTIALRKMFKMHIDKNQQRSDEERIRFIAYATIFIAYSKLSPLIGNESRNESQTAFPL